MSKRKAKELYLAASRLQRLVDQVQPKRQTIPREHAL
jgi:hypothetical protein